MQYATVTDLEARWRPLSTAEKDRASVLLEDAATRIDAAAPLGDDPAPIELSMREMISCEMVKRAMASGTGQAVTQESQTAGPFNAQWTFSNPTGDLYLLRAERQLLGVVVQRAGNVSLLGREE